MLVLDLVLCPAVKVPSNSLYQERTKFSFSQKVALEPKAMTNNKSFKRQKELFPKCSKKGKHHMSTSKHQFVFGNTQRFLRHPFLSYFPPVKPATLRGPLRKEARLDIISELSTVIKVEL